MSYTDKKKEAAYHKKWYQENKQTTLDRANARKAERREWYAEYKSALSCECGENHPACLDFHHVDEGTKKYNIANMVSSGYSEKAILEEIRKCIVLCANCHRKIHYKMLP